VDVTNVEARLHRASAAEAEARARPLFSLTALPALRQVASVSMPAEVSVPPVEAACHYVPGAAFRPQYTTYDKTRLEAVLARVNAAATTS